MYQNGIISCNKYATLMKDINNWGSCKQGGRRGERCMGNLCFLPKFSGNLKLL